MQITNYLIFFKKMYFTKCEEKGLRDYLQIGGTSGLDTSKLVVAESLCGVARNRRK